MYRGCLHIYGTVQQPPTCVIISLNQEFQVVPKLIWPLAPTKDTPYWQTGNPSLNSSFLWWGKVWVHGLWKYRTQRSKVRPIALIGILTTLQRKSHLCIPRKGIAWRQSQFPHSWVCECLYIPRIGPHISCSRIGRLILGIYKSLYVEEMLSCKLLSTVWWY